MNYLIDISSADIVFPAFFLLLGFLGLISVLLNGQASSDPEGLKKFLMKLGFSDEKAGRIIAQWRIHNQKESSSTRPTIYTPWAGDKKYGVAIIESKYECSRCKLAILSAYTPKKDFAGKCPKSKSGHNWQRRN